jgi:hypothetical protein
MNENKPIIKRSLFRQAIKPLAFAIIACGVVYYLFSSLGPISQYYGVNISFLILPFLGYYILRLLSRLSPIVLRSVGGIVCALILNGIAFSFFSYFILNRAPLFEGVPSLSHFDTLYSEMQSLSGLAILFFTGYTITKLSELLKSTVADSRAYPPDLALGQIIIGYSLWQSFVVFSLSWSPFRGIGLIIFIGILALAASNIGEYGKKSKYPLIADASNWLKLGAVGKFVFASLIAAYFIFARPALIGITPWAYIIEWLIVCFVSWRIFSNIRDRLVKRYCSPVRETAWQKHEQEITEFVGDDFDSLVGLQASFVDESAKDKLLASLKVTLTNNKLGENEINQKIGEINKYKDRKVPWFAFGFWKRRILNQNRNNRRIILNSTLKNLNTLTHQNR